MSPEIVGEARRDEAKREETRRDASHPAHVIVEAVRGEERGDASPGSRDFQTVRIGSESQG